MNDPSYEVDGLRLPPALLQAIREGRWKEPPDPDVLREVFGDEPDFPKFYDLDWIASENRFFHARSAADPEELLPGATRGLGVDPSLAVIIGDLGTDMPIALDYRLHRDKPRVIYLAWPDGWREVAPDVETLLQALGL